MSLCPSCGSPLQIWVLLQAFWVLVIASPVALGVTVDGPLAGVRLNSVTDGKQQNASAAMAPNGIGMVVWEQGREPGEDTEIFGRLVDALGVPVGNDFQVNVATEGLQSDPVISVTPEGNFVVVWLGSADHGLMFPVMARVFAANGNALTDEILVYEKFSALEPSVAAQPGGGFVVVWRSEGVQFRLYAANGSPRGPAINVTGDSGSVYYPVVTAGGAGQFMVLWSTDEGIVGRRFSADGVPISDDILVEFGSNILCDATMGEAGELAIATVRIVQTSPPSNPPLIQVFLRRLDPAGKTVGLDFISAAGAEWERPHLARSASGGLFLGWNQSGHLTGRRFYPSGAMMGSDFRLNSVPGDRFGRSVHSGTISRGIAIDANGGVLAAWTRPDGWDLDIFAGKLPLPDAAVVKGEPDGITTRSVKLRGVATARGEPLTVWCEYGIKVVSEKSSALRITVDGADSATVEFPLAGLYPHVTYRYRLVGEDSRGRFYSDEGTFRTLNTPPVANDDELHPLLQPVIVVDAAWNDSDADGDGKVIVNCTNGEHGTVAIIDYKLHYTPDASYDGNDAFQYTISDGTDTATATVRFRNAVPVIPDKTIRAPLIGASTVIFNVGADASQLDKDEITVTLGQSPWPGAVSISGGVVRLTSLGVRGAEHVRLNWSDGHGGRGSCKVTLTNLEPKAFDCAMTGTAEELSLLLTPYMQHGGDGDELFLESITQGAFGTTRSIGDRVFYKRGLGFEGRDAFNYTVSDRRGYTATGTVSVMSTVVAQRVLASRSGEVPGISPPDEAPATWVSFGIPSFAGTELGWFGRVRTSAGVFAGVFAGEPEAPRLLLRAGDLAPDEAGVAVDESRRFVRFNEPVFGVADSFAVVATIGGRGVSPLANMGLWARAQGELQRVAMRGAPAAGVAHGVFEAFVSVAMNGQKDLFFVARLRAGGPAAIGPSNDVGLWRWSRVSGCQLLLREGAEIEVSPGILKKVASFHALSMVSGSTGEGRYGAGVATRIRFVDKAEALAVCGSDGVRFEAFTGATPIGILGRFGIPDQFDDGNALVATASPVSGAPQNAPIAQVVMRTGTGVALAQTTGIAPGTSGARFVHFRPPVAGTDRYGRELIVFGATTSGSVAKNQGIWSWSEGDLTLIARKGEPASEANGAVWTRFLSLAILPDYGLMFTATIARPGATAGSPEARGLWATDSTGVLRLVAIAGNVVQVGEKSKILRNIDLLGGVSGSPGQRRAFGEDPGRIVYRGTFSDGSTAIIRATLP